MSKEQKRGREAKKPKAAKPPKAGSTPSVMTRGSLTPLTLIKKK